MTDTTDAIQQPNDNLPAEKPLPPPPDADIEADRTELAQERWTHCPLRDCKRDANLLYEDFYLRGIRSDRLMCSACAVRTEVGYMAREIVKKSDDRFFAGTTTDYAIQFAVIAGLSLVVNTIMQFIGFWILAFFVGGGAGMFIGRTARRLSGGRVGRQSANLAVGATLIGALLSPIGFGLFQGGGAFISFLLSDLSIYFRFLFDFAVIITTAIMAATIYGIFMRRI